jgi:hypothetical protein
MLSTPHPRAFLRKSALVQPPPLLAAMEFGSDVCFVDAHADTEDIFQLEVDDGLANCAKEQAEAWRDAADEEGRSNEERHVIETVISRSGSRQLIFLRVGHCFCLNGTRFRPPTSLHSPTHTRATDMRPSHSFHLGHLTQVHVEARPRRSDALAAKVPEWIGVVRPPGTEPHRVGAGSCVEGGCERPRAPTPCRGGGSKATSRARCVAFHPQSTTPVTAH